MNQNKSDIGNIVIKNGPKESVVDYAKVPHIMAAAPKSIADISTSSLVKTVLKWNPTPEPWIRELMDQPNAPLSGLSLTAACQELMVRRNLGCVNYDINEAPSKLAATHVVSISLVQVKDTDAEQVVVKFADDKSGKVLSTTQLGGYTLPKGNEDMKVKIQNTVLANAMLFPFISSDAPAEAGSTKTQQVNVDVSLASYMGFPLFKSHATIMPVLRRKEILNNVVKTLAIPGYKKEVLGAMPDGVVWDEKRALFTVDKKYLRPIKVKDCRALYDLILKYRALRGADYAPRHEVTSGYYFGIVGRGFFTVCYMVHDILALGKKLNINTLEINGIDGIMTMHICQSLISHGWLIRVVGPSMFPERDEEKMGIFSYFASTDMYLRFCHLSENPPQMVSGNLKMTVGLNNTIKRAMKVGLDDYAVPFCYAYLQDELREIGDDYFLFPTTHAHNGHVIVVKATLGQDSGYEFDFSRYLTRVSDANVKKSMYYLTRVPYFLSDPFRHKLGFFVRNRVKKMIFVADDKVEFIDDMSYDISDIYDVDDQDEEIIEIEKPLLIRKKEQLMNEAQVLIAEKLSLEQDPVEDVAIQELIEAIDDIKEEIAQQQEQREKITVEPAPPEYEYEPDSTLQDFKQRGGKKVTNKPHNVDDFKKKGSGTTNRKDKGKSIKKVANVPIEKPNTLPDLF